MDVFVGLAQLIAMEFALDWVDLFFRCCLCLWYRNWHRNSWIFFWWYFTLILWIAILIIGGYFSRFNVFGYSVISFYLFCLKSIEGYSRSCFGPICLRRLGSILLGYRWVWIFQLGGI